MRLASHGGAAYVQIAPSARIGRLDGTERFTRRNNRETFPPYGRPVDVVLVRWPAEAARRDELRREGLPCLLLLEDGVAPPSADPDDLEDWIRCPPARSTSTPGSTGSGGAARHAKTRRPSSTTTACSGSAIAGCPCRRWRLGSPPRCSTGSVRSSPATPWQGRVARRAPGRNALDVHMLRLRRRLSPLALAIRTVRSRGYLLERVVTSEPAPG